MPVDFEYDLVNEPGDGGGSGGGSVANDVTLPVEIRARSFLGNGLLIPFRRDRKTDFANGSNEALVRSCVAQVLGTQASDEEGRIRGELPWRPRFGSMLHKLKHRHGHVLKELARAYVLEALRRWEPRVLVTDCYTTFDRVTRVLSINLRYDIVVANTSGNNVVLRDIDQTVDVPLAA